MFSCMSKKRDRSQNTRPPTQAPQPRPNRGNATERANQPTRETLETDQDQRPAQPKQQAKRLPTASRRHMKLQDDPLTDACWQGFGDRGGERQQPRRKPRRQNTSGGSSAGQQQQNQRQPQPETRPQRPEVKPFQQPAASQVDSKPVQQKIDTTQNNDFDAGRPIDTAQYASGESGTHVVGQANLDKYLQFIKHQNRQTRFQPEEINELKQHFTKVAVKQKMMVEDAHGRKSLQTVNVMKKEQFRSQMGLLGQQQHPYLADRIFEVFDTDGDGVIQFDLFTMIMDVLCNGTEDEKSQFSFALMDINGNGLISFEEFYQYFTQVIGHWSSLINSHVRVDKREMHDIFRKIDIDDDKVVRYSEYRRALRKNPELVDWFHLLNSAKTENKPGNDAAAAVEDPKKVKIDKEKVDKILRLKTTKDKKEVTVKRLKSKINEQQDQTEEQLQAIIKQISDLQGQVQKELSRKQEEKKVWEESQLNQVQETLMSYEPMSQFHQGGYPANQSVGGQSTPDVVTQPNHLRDRDQQLNALLCDDVEPFQAAETDVEAVGRDHPNQELFRGGTRQPAMTFGFKSGMQSKQQQTTNQQPYRMVEDERKNRHHDVDSDATLQQWQNKTLLQKNGSNSPTGQSSNFHFSQFNYEFNSRNASIPNDQSIMKSSKPSRQYADTYLDKEMSIEAHKKAKPITANGPPDNFQIDDRHLRTQENTFFDGTERIGHSQRLNYQIDKGRHFETRKLLKSAYDNDQRNGPPTQQNYSNLLSSAETNHGQKTYQEVMGPSASLDDILNFDFAKRYERTASISKQSSTAARTGNSAITPIFEVLIKLRQGQEQAREKVGEKHCAIEQVPSKQKIVNSDSVDSQNRVGQKLIDDDIDDIVLDPESPSHSPSQAQHLQPSQSSQTQQQHPSALKVNMRHQKRLELRQSQTNLKQFDTSQSNMSSNMNKMSQMQGGTAIPSHRQQAVSDTISAQNGHQYGSNSIPYSAYNQAHHQQQMLQHRTSPHLTASMTNPPQSNQMYGYQQHQPAQYTNTGHKDRGYASDAIQNFNEHVDGVGSHHIMNTSVEHDQIDLVPNHQGSRLSNTPPVCQQQRLPPYYPGTKSAYNQDARLDTLSQFSHQMAKSQQPYANVKPPESPKAEKEILDKLDSVSTQVVSWLQQLEKGKNQRSKSSNDDRQGSLGKIRLAKRSVIEDDNVTSYESDDVKSDEDEENWLEELKGQVSKEETKDDPFFRTDPDANNKRTVTFDEARPSNMLVSTKQSPRSPSPAVEHEANNKHQAKSNLKAINRSKKDTTFIHFGNDNWNLVLHMLFGIRQSVHSSMYDDVYQLTDAEFKSKSRYELEAVEDQKIWNLKKYEFYDFSPRMFNLIRKFYGIDSTDYLKSIGPETLFGSLNMGNVDSLKSQCSAGKSGSLFYYTADGLYMLKTISHDEFVHFKAIMKNYYHHMLAYPHTMITRFYGLHKIKFTRTTRIERVYFVIMANVFNTPHNINVRYDLKGSTYGRRTRKHPDEVLSSSVALKDLDWLTDKRLINLRDEQRALILQQLKADTKFFQENNINDYSVLLGISKLKGGPREAQEIVKQGMDFDMLYLQGINNEIDQDEKRKMTRRTKSTNLGHGPIAGASPNDDSLFDDLDYQNSRMLSLAQPLQRNDSELLLHERKRPSKAFFESQAGGLVSADGTEVYFMGIIDILTNFGTKKKIENTLKSIVQNSRTISCIPPYQYGERFYQFMTQRVYLTQEQILTEIRCRNQNKKSPVFDAPIV